MIVTIVTILFTIGTIVSVLLLGYLADRLLATPSKKQAPAEWDQRDAAMQEVLDRVMQTGKPVFGNVDEAGNLTMLDDPHELPVVDTFEDDAKVDPYALLQRSFVVRRELERAIDLRNEEIEGLRAIIETQFVFPDGKGWSADCPFDWAPNELPVFDTFEEAVAYALEKIKRRKDEA